MPLTAKAKNLLLIIQNVILLDISKTPSTPSTHDPRPTTLDTRLYYFFYASLFIKFGKQYQVNVGSPSATTLAERLKYILRRGTIRNIIMLALDAYRLSSESLHCPTLTLAQHCSSPMIAKHSKHEALNPCWIHAGPTSVTLAHHMRCRCQCV